MLTSKRAKIREEIRKADLNRIFTMKRKSLLQGSKAVMNDLYKQVRINQHEVQDYDLINRLLQCVQLNPQDQNAYIIIGNYLLDHNHSHPHFYHLIVDHPKVMESHSWCLFLLANITFQQYTQSKQQRNHNQDNKLYEILMCSTKVCEQLNSNYHLSNYLQFKCILYAYFEEIFKLVLTSPVQTLIDDASILVFCKILHFYGEEETSQENLADILKIVYFLSDRWEIFSTKITENLFIKQTFNIVMMGMTKMPFQRQKIIRCSRKILLNNTSEFIQTFYNDQFLREIFYLFDEVLSLKPSILKLIIDLAPQTELNQLAMLLNLKCHIHITRYLEWSMQNYDNQCLQNCLIFMYNLLNRLNQMNQIQLVDRILKEIAQQNFDQMIDGLTRTQQSQGIQNVVNNLIDDFYSQQVL